MKIEEYKKLFPSEEVSWITKSKSFRQEMVQFDETADYWAGPFEGGFAYASIYVEDSRFLQSEEQIRLKFRLGTFNFSGKYKNPSKDESHLQKRLSELTNRELKEWEHKNSLHKIDSPSLEMPVVLVLRGNDDCSYSKFFKTLAEAEQELETMLSMQPCNITVNIKDQGFVFTN